MATFLLNLGTVDEFSVILTVAPAKASVLWCRASALGQCVEEPSETERCEKAVIMHHYQKQHHSSSQ